MIKKILSFGVLLFTLACSTASEKDRDGLGYRYTVTCRNEVQDCYQRCSDLCPDGYLVTNRVRGRRISESDNEYSVIIRCREKTLHP